MIFQAVPKYCGKLERKFIVTWKHKCDCIHEAMKVTIGGEKRLLLYRAKNYTVHDLRKISLEAIRSVHNYAIIDYTEIELGDGDGKSIYIFDGQEGNFWSSSLVVSSRGIYLTLLTTACKAGDQLAKYKYNKVLYGLQPLLDAPPSPTSDLLLSPHMNQAALPSKSSQVFRVPPKVVKKPETVTFNSKDVFRRPNPPVSQRLHLNNITNAKLKGLLATSAEKKGLKYQDKYGMNTQAKVTIPIKNSICSNGKYI